MAGYRRKAPVRNVYRHGVEDRYNEGRGAAAGSASSRTVVDLRAKKDPLTNSTARYTLAAFVATLLLVPLAATCAADSPPALRGANLAPFDITKFGATPNDDTDDTLAIAAALRACGDAGGGVVFVPAGKFIVARQGTESPILVLPSNTMFRGEGAASVLKFAPTVKNFWRMVGAGAAGCRNVTICDLRLDGSNTYPRYDKGKTPEHNAGVYLSSKDGVIENVTVRNLLVENFSGDCVAVGRGCRNITVRDVAVRNFLRQGIQLAGDENARDYLVSGCQDLEHSVQPGGSTIHVEHARGLRGVIIQGNRCRHSILAGGVDGLIVRDNIVRGRIEGNSDTNAIVEGNIVVAHPGATRALMQFGYADGLVVRGNILRSGNAEQGGIYVCGASRYNSAPSKNVLIADNVLRVKGQPISLNGVKGGLVRDNLVEGSATKTPVAAKRAEGVEVYSSHATGGQ